MLRYQAAGHQGQVNVQGQAQATPDVLQSVGIVLRYARTDGCALSYTPRDPRDTGGALIGLMVDNAVRLAVGDLLFASEFDRSVTDLAVLAQPSGGEIVCRASVTARSGEAVAVRVDVVELGDVDSVIALGVTTIHLARCSVSVSDTRPAKVISAFSL